MKRKPRGLCVVINNMHFDGDVRKGSEHDERSLREVFEGLLHFKVEVYKDLTAADMELTLLRAARKNHSDYDAFACVILSHGSTNGVSGVGSRSLDLNSCLRFFNSYNCPTLHNKPKLFFVQACRGGGKDGKGAAAAAAASAYRRGAESDGDDCDEADGDAEEDAASKFKELPATETADFLLAFSTPFGYVRSDERACTRD
jgi:caspase 10